MAGTIRQETYRQKTGKQLSEWLRELDDQSAKEWTHKQTVAYLAEKHGLDAWWAQMITVDYEKHHGKRVVGETQDAGFEIGVQRTLPIDAIELWELLISPAGASLWLGEPVNVVLEKGQTFRATGSTYEVRSCQPGVKLRLRKTSTREPMSTLQLYVTAKESSSILLFHQEKLQSKEAREAAKAHWQHVLDALKSYIKTKEN